MDFIKEFVAAIEYDPYYVGRDDLFIDDHLEKFKPTSKDVDELRVKMALGGRPISEGMAQHLIRSGAVGSLQRRWQELYNPGPRFTFAIGRKFNPENDEGCLDLYSNGFTTFKGTMKDADELCDEANKKEPDTGVNPYQVFKLVVLNEDDKKQLRS